MVTVIFSFCKKRDEKQRSKKIFFSSYIFLSRSFEEANFVTRGVGRNASERNGKREIERAWARSSVLLPCLYSSTKKQLVAARMAHQLALFCRSHSLSIVAELGDGMSLPGYAKAGGFNSEGKKIISDFAQL